METGSYIQQQQSLLRNKKKKMRKGVCKEVMEWREEERVEAGDCSERERVW